MFSHTDKNNDYVLLQYMLNAAAKQRKNAYFSPHFSQSLP